MRHISLGLWGVLLVLSITWSLQAETYVSGNVSGTWTPYEDPYLVVGDLVVPPGELLFIKPGTWVIFLGEYQFDVHGQIIAWGIQNDSIYFTSRGTTWNGFRFIGNMADTSQFYYTLFENADNYPDGYGGVFYTYNSDLVIEHCTFQHNRANRGAGIYAYLGYLRFRYNVCWDNEVYHCGGAINLGVEYPSVVARCVFYDNTSAPNNGGALYFWDDHSQVINCTVVQNTSDAVLSINGSTTTFLNCIFWYNDMGEVYGATFSDIPGIWPGQGNISADPMFTNPGSNNFHLMPESPCIDAGNPLSPRDPDGTTADMGAYYYNQDGPGEDLHLMVEPDTIPTTVPAQGGFIPYEITAWYTGTDYVIFDFWVRFRIPTGELLPYIFFLHQNLYLGPGESIARECSLYVNSLAMPGLYEYRAYLGQCPDTVWAFDSFPFEKLAGSAPCGNGYAVLTGWDMEEIVHLNENSRIAGEGLTLQHHPEPFNPTTTISYELRAASRVNLKVYDTAGRSVATLANGWREAGRHDVTFDGSGLATGVYLYRLEAEEQTACGKLVLLK